MNKGRNGKEGTKISKMKKLANFFVDWIILFIFAT
jgi:hypothetical protein